MNTFNPHLWHMTRLSIAGAKKYLDELASVREPGHYYHQSPTWRVVRQEEKGLDYGRVIEGNTVVVLLSETEYLRLLTIDDKLQAIKHALVDVGLATELYVDGKVSE